MVMKDKLVKNHHRGIYYRMRKMSLFILAGFTFAAAIVVPTYINATLHKKTTSGLAQEAKHEDSSKVVEEEKESESIYEEYNRQ